MQVAIVGCVPKSQENGGVTFLETKMIESDNSTTFVFQRKFVPGSILSLPRPIPFYKKFPVIDLHLPFDFFYPFVSD
jgi:hypothetical protein